MRNSRGDLRGIPSRGKAGAPPVPARSRREKASEEVLGPKSLPFRQREIAVCRAPPWCDLTPKRKRRGDFANWRGRHWCPSREQRRTVSGGAPHPNAAHQTSHLSLARTTGEAKIRCFLLDIASAWLFDFYAHASDKWDVSDKRFGAGSVKPTPKLMTLRFS